MFSISQIAQLHIVKQTSYKELKPNHVFKLEDLKQIQITA